MRTGQRPDEGIVFEPIHRLLSGVKPEALDEIAYILAEQNGDVSVQAESFGTSEFAHMLRFVREGETGALTVPEPASRLAVATLQNALEAYVKKTGAKLDYIHGDETLISLATRPDCLGFLLPAMEKSELFATVILEGALPKKTFSMGEARKKGTTLKHARSDKISEGKCLLKSSSSEEARWPTPNSSKR
jgi:hypothetical protein